MCLWETANERGDVTTTNTPRCHYCGRPTYSTWYDHTPVCGACKLSLTGVPSRSMPSDPQLEVAQAAREKVSR